jgi:HAMP domain-containing protein
MRRAPQALVQRLPLSLRIDGPQVQYDSHPGDRPDDGDRYERDAADGAVGGWSAAPPTATASASAWPCRPTRTGPHRLGHAGRAAGADGAAYAWVRHLLRPLGDIGRCAAFGRGDFAQPIAAARPDELGALAERINAMATSLQHMLEGQRGAAAGHQPRTAQPADARPPERRTGGRRASARTPCCATWAEMRDLISTCWKANAWPRAAAALQREPVDLNALVRDLADRQFAGRASLDLD